ncbi:MAG: lysophospholipid acyltransferase family protein [Leptospirillum sp.]
MGVETKTPMWLLKSMALGVRALGPEAGSRAGSLLGDALRFIMKSKGKLARENLRAAYPEASEEWILEVEKKMFRHLGRMGVEFLQFPDKDEAWLRQHVQVSGIERAHAALALGKGALILSAHFGNWEYIFKRLSYDFPKDVYALTRRIKDPNVDLFVKEYREANTGATCILQDNAGSQIVRILKKNGIVITVLDQNAGVKEGAFVPFFGRLASTYTSTARLSLRLGLPVIPVLGHRTTGLDHFVCVMDPIIPDPSLCGENAVEVLTARFTSLLEKAIREYPEQWIWLHNRWKTRPPGEDGKNLNAGDLPEGSPAQSEKPGESV